MTSGITCEALPTGEFKAICTCAGLDSPARATRADAGADADEHTAKTGHQIARATEDGS